MPSLLFILWLAVRKLFSQNPDEARTLYVYVEPAGNYKDRQSFLVANRLESLATKRWRLMSPSVAFWRLYRRGVGLTLPFPMVEEKGDERVARGILYVPVARLLRASAYPWRALQELPCGTAVPVHCHF